KNLCRPDSKSWSTAIRPETIRSSEQTAVTSHIPTAANCFSPLPLPTRKNRTMRVSPLSVALMIALCLAPAAYGQPPSNDYADPKSWLCRPGAHDACDTDLTTTVIYAGGKLSREMWSADPNAPIDCFYVYPTVSTDPTPNSDMIADPAELNVIRQQFARFASKCRPYAPMYRQITLAGLRRLMAAGNACAALSRGQQYDDVRDAWKYYLGHDNKGRGF